jgi:hypothetical protein
MMRHLIVFSATLALLSCLLPATTRGQGTQANTQNAQANSNNNQVPGFTSDIQDPVVALHHMRQRREQAKTPDYALFQRSPLTPLRERAIAAEKRIYEATDIKFGTNLNTLFQGLGDNIPGTDSYGMSSFMQSVATWDGFNKGEHNQGEITLGL